MVPTNDRSSNNRNGSDLPRAFRIVAICLVWAIPVIAMTLEACKVFDLDANWVALYALIAGLGAAAFRIPWKPNGKNGDTKS